MRSRKCAIAAAFAVLLAFWAPVHSAAAEKCTYNFECESKFCTRGRCRRAREVGERCTVNFECESKFCTRGKCRRAR